MIDQCGECNACCSGALQVTILGHIVNKNNPCPMLCKDGSNGCSIYNDQPIERPQICKTYKCRFLRHESWGIELRPDKCGIIVDKPRGSVPFLRMIKVRDQYDLAAFEFFKQYAKSIDHKIKFVEQ